MNSVETTRLPDLNFCMYCGKCPPEVTLTNEHVLARGLNGDLLLPQSTCGNCQLFIGRDIETPILKNRWLTHSRLVLGFRSQSKPKNQIQDIKVEFVSHDGTYFTKKVPKKEAIAAITLPFLIQPRSLTLEGELIEKDGMEIYGTYDHIVHNHETTNVANSDQQTKILCEKYRARAVRLSIKVSPTDLCRFLAKTAYGYHVAMRGGFPRVESPALAVMKGTQLDLSNWVGAEEVEHGPGQPKLHDMEIEDRFDGNGQVSTVVTIRLFSSYGHRLRYVVVTRSPGWKTRLIPDPNPARAAGEIHLL